MVEFMSQYLPAMENFKERPITPTEDVDIEQPLIPIGDIGTTSVDAGQGNILQNLESNIKMGAKKIQIVFTPGRGGISSGPSSFGQEVRRSLAEKAQATGAEIIGVELSPAMISGLAGFDPQSGRITEERRYADMKKVKDAIRFAADVSKGGAVDLWSQEFNRNIADADWNTDDKSGKWKGQFYDYSEKDLGKDANLLKYLLDKRTGQPIQASAVRTGEPIQELKWMTAKDYERQYPGVKLVGKKDRNGNLITEKDYVDYRGDVVNEFEENSMERLIPRIDPEKHTFETTEITWEKIQERTKKYNDKNKTNWTPEEFLYRKKLETQRMLIHGQSLHYSQNLEGMYDELRELAKMEQSVEKQQAGMSKEEREEYVRTILLPKLSQNPHSGIRGVDVERMARQDPVKVVQDAIIRQQNAIHGYQEQAASHKVQVAELEEMEKNIVTPQSFAFQKSIESYAEMGIDAMKVTQERKLKAEGGTLEKPIYIGPELGWASESFGGHPQEFIKLITKAREKMAETLKKDHGLNDAEAKERAKTHIKGMVDTSHLAMWYKHFKRDPNDSDEKHLDKFKGWMKEQAVAMVKSGVVGGVQVVDSITGEHSHLPAGQGIFDVADMVKEMKKAGFDGPIIAEGHEEDTGGFGSGRILTETWKAFGSNIASTGGYQMGLRGFGGIQHAYFGRVTPPTYVVGAYAPSNEWSLWSETPFE